MMRALLTLMVILAFFEASAGRAETALQTNNEILFQQLQQVHRLSDAQMTLIRSIFARSGYVGQGNPAISSHPMTPAQCQSRVPGGPDGYSNPRFERI